MTDTTRAELESERDFLLRSIRDLDAELAEGNLGEDDYRALREQYTARTAAVLRALAHPGGAEVEEAADDAVPPSRRWRAVAGVAVVLVVAVVAGVVVSTSAGERLPGDQISGSVTEGANAKVARAQQLVGEGEALEAVKLYDEVLEEDPEHPVALAQRGWLISRAGLLDEGLAYVDRAIESEPRYAEARFFRAMILRDQGHLEAAAAELRALLALNPPDEVAAFAEDVLAQLENLRQ